MSVTDTDCPWQTQTVHYGQRLFMTDTGCIDVLLKPLTYNVLLRKCFSPKIGACGQKIFCGSLGVRQISSAYLIYHRYITSTSDTQMSITIQTWYGTHFPHTSSNRHLYFIPSITSPVYNHMSTILYLTEWKKIMKPWHRFVTFTLHHQVEIIHYKQIIIKIRRISFVQELLQMDKHFINWPHSCALHITLHSPPPNHKTVHKTLSSIPQLPILVDQLLISSWWK